MRTDVCYFQVNPPLDVLSSLATCEHFYGLLPLPNGAFRACHPSFFVFLDLVLFFSFPRIDFFPPVERSCDDVLKIQIREVYWELG